MTARAIWFASRDFLADFLGAGFPERFGMRGSCQSVPAGASPKNFKLSHYHLRVPAAIAGPEYAQTLQLIMEYDPAPPFDAGSPEKAGPETTQRAFGAMVEMMQTLAARAAS